MSSTAWEAIFMLVVLKIPMLYLGLVVWWAIRAEPRSDAGTDEVGVLVPLTPCNWDEWKRRRPRGGIPRPRRASVRRAAARAPVA